MPKKTPALKPLALEILLVLLERERHGYSIARAIEQRRSGARIEAGSLYRTLRTMLRDGLIEESDQRPDPELDDERRRYFRVTAAGRDAAAATARQFGTLVDKARELDLLKGEANR
jgi:DNA-binding PadR family transcriptional regulator